MSIIKLSGGGASYKHSSVKFDCQNTINMYGERGVSGSADEWVWIGRPGSKLFGNATSGSGEGNRALFKTSLNRCFAVNGNSLFEIQENGTDTLLGTLSSNTGRVSMAENGLVIMIVDGINGYFFNLTTNVLTQITDPDFDQACSTVVYLDGRFVFNRINTDTFGITDLDVVDPASCIDGYQAGVAENSPDNIVGLAVFGRNLYVFGTQTYQVFYTSDSVDFPIEPVNGAFYQIGCGSAESIAVGIDGVYWVGEDKAGHGTMYKTVGFQFQAISNFAITAEIGTFDIKNDAEGTIFTYNGHQFYVVGFKHANKTFTYDSTTGLWAQWASNQQGVLNRFRGVNSVYFSNKVLIGDTISGNIYWLDSNYYQDHYGVLTRERTFPHINQNGEKVCYLSLKMICENGVGLENGNTPYIMMSYSNDGGRAFFGEIWRSLGKIGEYKTPVEWYQLGESRDRIFRLRQTDPVKAYWISIIVEVKV